jgi:putative membrane protein
MQSQPDRPAAPPAGKPWLAFFQRWAITTLGVLVAANVVNGIRYDTKAGLIVASLLLGVLNAFLKPIMLLLSLPLLIFTFGFFALFINAFLLYLVGQVVKSFHVATFGAAFWGGVLISITSLSANLLLGSADGRVVLRRGSQNSGPRRPPGGNGPVIDV